MKIDSDISRLPITLINKPLSSEKVDTILKIGEIINARILSKQGDNTYLLQLKEQPKPQSQPQQLQIKTDIKLDIGQSIQLKVTNNTPQPTLQLVNIDKTEQMIVQAMRTLLAKQAPINELLTNIVQLSQATKGSGAIPNPLPEQLNQLLKQLLSNTPTPKSITTASGVKQAIDNSGMFLEQKLSTPNLSSALLNSAIDKDVRGVLLKLAYTLRELAKEAAANKPLPTENKTPPTDTKTQQPMPEGKSQPPQMNIPKALQAVATAVSPRTQPLPLAESELTKEQSRALFEKATLPTSAEQLPLKGMPLRVIPHGTARLQANMPMTLILKELSQLTESTLARNQLQQLAVLPTADDSSPVWTFDIPLLNNNKIDMIQLRIEPEQEHNTDENERQRRLNISLTLNFEPLGPVHIFVNMEGSETISAKIWAEKSQSVSLFNEHMERLHQRFIDQGLNLKHIHCYHGAPPSPPERKPPPKPFLDIEI